MKLISGQRGVGLIEVMVTVLILSTSLLGLAALQNKALQYNHSAYMRSQANILAYDMLERVRANRTKVADYKLAVTASTPTSSSSLAGQDLIEWRELLKRQLPNGTGGITCDNDGNCTATIRWGEQDSTAADGTTSFEYMTRI
ncbi:type IV pilus modification protein PilV [Microbulbifer variabilis]|uniref:type IV pilus modification protein PilV n=1 Tax=Microbulbifer variabilis TaxID=266805 RepID=UPI001CFED322|nr:type IV pilus modification protein PilV [Microbulbifer variabilis]